MEIRAPELGISPIAEVRNDTGRQVQALWCVAQDRRERRDYLRGVAEPELAQGRQLTADAVDRVAEDRHDTRSRVMGAVLGRVRLPVQFAPLVGTIGKDLISTSPQRASSNTGIENAANVDGIDHAGADRGDPRLRV